MTPEEFDMTPEEFEKAKEEVADYLYRMIELGLMETHAIDEDGNFTYRLTKEGRDIAEELNKDEGDER